MRNFLKFLVVIGLVLVVNKANSQQFLGGGTGTADDPYKIYTAAQWDEFAEEYATNNTNRYGDFSNIHIRLMNDLIGEEKISKILFSYSLLDTEFNGYFHGGGHKIDISEIIFYKFNQPTDEFLIQEGSLFNNIAFDGIVDSLEIVGTSKNFNAIIGGNRGKLYNLVCNIICEPTSEIYNSFFLEYVMVMEELV